MGGRRKTSRIVGSKIHGAGLVGLGVIGMNVGGLYGPKGIKHGLRNVKKGSRQILGRRGTGSGGRQKGHPFYGNQHVKVSKYSRKKSGKRRGKRRLYTWKGD